MLLREKLDMLYKSEVLRLNWQGSTVGLRVKIFNISSDLYEYYDFSTRYVKDKQVRDFLVKQNFRIDELHEHNGLLMTQGEINGVVSVQEFKNEDDALRVLIPVMRVYEVLNGGDGVV